jgi:hypothetical protein
MIKYLSILILKAHINTCAWNYAGGKNQDIGNTHGAAGVGHWCAAARGHHFINSSAWNFSSWD